MSNRSKAEAALKAQALKVGLVRDSLDTDPYWAVTDTQLGHEVAGCLDNSGIVIGEVTIRFDLFDSLAEWAQTARNCFSDTASMVWAKNS